MTTSKGTNLYESTIDESIKDEANVFQYVAKLAIERNYGTLAHGLAASVWGAIGHPIEEIGGSIYFKLIEGLARRFLKVAIEAAVDAAIEAERKEQSHGRTEN
jgi:hypothetical protein